MTTTEIATVEETQVVAMDEASARALTDQIKANGEHLWTLLADAYMNRAWQALGFESWDAYCDSEFGALRLQLPREKRKDTVASLRSAGLSLAAIASVTGESTSQASRDADGISHNGKSEDGKRGPGRPKGSKNKPKPDVTCPDSNPEIIDAEIIPPATEFDLLLAPENDPVHFKDTADVLAAFGDIELGAVAVAGAVISYRRGFELDTMQPHQARVLAAAFLQAADRAEA